MTCVGCDKKYKISDYDGNYEEIGEKKIVKFVENHIPPRGTKTVCGAEVKDTFDTESDYLPPLFDLTDAPILDFATPLGSDDPSLLISKVRYACSSRISSVPLSLSLWNVFYAEENQTFDKISH